MLTILVELRNSVHHLRVSKVDAAGVPINLWRAKSFLCFPKQFRQVECVQEVRNLTFEHAYKLTLNASFWKRLRLRLLPPARTKLMPKGYCFRVSYLAQKVPFQSIFQQCVTNGTVRESGFSDKTSRITPLNESIVSHYLRSSTCWPADSKELFTKTLFEDAWDFFDF